MGLRGSGPARRWARLAPRKRAAPDGPGAQWLAETLRHAPVGVAVLDSDLRYQSINPALAALNGLPEEAHLGRTVEEVLPQLPADLLGAMRLVIATGKPGHHLQASGTDRAGSTRHVEADFYPVRGARGRVTGLVAVVRDETARARLLEEQRQLRAQAEAAAAERERLVKDLRRTLRERDESVAVLDALFGNAPVGLALLDRDMRLRRVNRSLADMNGLPVMQHLGRSLAEILPGMSLEPIARALRQTLESLEPVIDLEIEGETPAAPGELRHWLHSLYPVAVGGQVIGVGALVREVTAQKRAAEFHGQLLGVVGHDLRSPLLAITSSAAMLQHGETLSERSARAVGRILSAASRMDGIVRALADYTRVQVGRALPLAIRRVHLRAVCREVIDEIQAARPGRLVSCRASGNQAGEWDADRIGQVVANLVGNALDFSPPESPVAVVCRGEPEEVVLEVHNRGDPIPPEFRPHLFEPFRRGPGADSKSGLGLGLFIARQNVLAHGGSIEVDSSAAEGTAFRVRLPRRARPRG